MQALIPEWMRSHREIYTWRSAVPVVCFNFVHMHHVDRVLRQYGGEQPVPRAPVDVTRLMSSTGRGDDVWWPERLATWYEGWRGRGSPQVLVTVHEGDLRGTQRYYEWFVAAARHGRAEEQQQYDGQDEPGEGDGGEAAQDDQPRAQAEEQPDYDPHDRGISPSAMISFSPCRYPSPHQEGTSSYHEHGHFQQHPFSPHQADTSAYHQQPFVPQTQEHTGLAELYQMTTCSPAEFSSIVNTFRMTRAQHSGPGGSGPWCPRLRPISPIQMSAIHRHKRLAMFNTLNTRSESPEHLVKLTTLHLQRIALVVRTNLQIHNRARTELL
ncbi:hypothetical protein PIB30_021876 [Stylosanthes scabra]|uniref:Uncharacterized protein n=1 Tax=Stylosanthes scabra TaxID=79078 RepID=A0ABU6R9C6_9FABA|nr:hypothetical protein [Stylosanthes scabra]